MLIYHTHDFCALLYVLCKLQVSAVVKESCEGVTQAAITRAQALTRAQHAATTAAAGVATATATAAAAAAAGSTVAAAAAADDDDAEAAAAAIDSTAAAGSSERQKADTSSGSSTQQQQQQQCGFVWAQIRVSPEQTLRDHYNAEAAATAKEDACTG
jgi:hypothetical protein